MTDETSMIVELFGKVAALEKDRDAWKRRAEAAERDLGYMIPCETCKEQPLSEKEACNTCVIHNDGWHDMRRSNYAWRGPCAENGGADNGPA